MPVQNEYQRELVLASRGKPYGEKLPDGTLTLEAWSTKIERMLLNDSISFEKRIDSLITSCTDIKDKSIDVDDLVLVDKQHIFFVIRCMSVGSDYMFSFPCSSCGKKATVTIDLDKKLDVVYIDENDDMQFEVELPICKDTIGWRLLTGKDERSITKFVKRSKKRGGTDSDPAYLFRAALRITSINGKADLELTEIMDYLDKLRGRDAVTFRESIVTVDIGVDPEIEAKCNWCHYVNDVMLPMDKNFFRSTEFVKRSIDRKIAEPS